MATTDTDRDLLKSLRRTIVPFIMGWIATLPIAQFVDTAEIEKALVVIIGSAYYAGLRFLESRGVPAASWWIAFGRTSAPIYPEVDPDASTS
jgi:hypothetical protein